MKCPYCNLINPPEAQRCDCGFDFTLKRLEKSYIPDAAAITENRKAKHIMAFGTIFLAVGGLIAGGMYYAAALDVDTGITITVLFIAGICLLIHGYRRLSKRA